MSDIKGIRQISKDEIITRIQKNPEMHFSSGKANEHDLISSLCKEMTLAGCCDISVRFIDDEWVITCDLDWLEVSADEYYTSVLKLDEGPAGGMKVGILLNAFSNKLIHIHSGKTIIIKGEECDDLYSIGDERKYGIIFKL